MLRCTWLDLAVAKINAFGILQASNLRHYVGEAPRDVGSPCVPCELCGVVTACERLNRGARRRKGDTMVMMRW